MNLLRKVSLNIIPRDQQFYICEVNTSWPIRFGPWGRGGAKGAACFESPQGIRLEFEGGVLIMADRKRKGLSEASGTDPAVEDRKSLDSCHFVKLSRLVVGVRQAKLGMDY